MDEVQLKGKSRVYFPFGIQISAHAWRRFRVADLAPLEDEPGRRPSILPVRHLADRMNESRATGADGRPPARAGELLLAGLLQEVFRYLMDRYCEDEQPEALRRAVAWVAASRGEATAHLSMAAFLDTFPPLRVMQGRQSHDDYRRAASGPSPERDALVRESILLTLVNENPALKTYRELFDDTELRRTTPYEQYLSSLEVYFDSLPPLSVTGQTLFKVLRAPMKASPHSLEGQLRFVLDHWRALLPAELWKELTFVQDVVREETRPRFGGSGPAPILRFGPGASGADADSAYPEPERFSHDLDWMSNVVLIAKSTYVWLDQLSRQYGRNIYRLDHIPDEELDQLARWGFNGLWLIGLWERSTASQKIKQAMGNPEALPSAYSLYDYVIAHDLGGPEAYANLRERAAQRGIRLASDMVPNHTGIYSRWVVEHPDWFIQSPWPPYPGYRFTGPDLSSDARITLRIEDGYWNHSDAAVVFQRVDNHSGETRYIYHGNDGTNMPWNDTAQLNYLLPEVREAVINTILHVARQFPIIRFDAAMTLAKRHFQRLWFPKPGDGGAVPSRAEHGMTKAEFDQHIPEEFWREVVDRVTQEVPDTLLLAEAFWLMEGYFVRTLGMHRVYNSAFMNMLKMEHNADYRTTIRNVLEFSPKVLKRFVNFMNNPDELTAVEQFGKGDKYFGAAMLMVTMPGLPMFGHGQVEGFTEKYGMEYRRARLDEQPDHDLIRRHEAEIFPLMRKRYLFSGVDHFAFYDFKAVGGYVDENVFAYSNCSGGERGLILYNNAYNTTSGWIRQSVPMNVGEGGKDRFVSVCLSEALALQSDANYFYIFRDTRENLEYIRSGASLTHDGLFAHLNGYQYQAFLDWREVYDQDGSWRRVAEELQGAGVPNMAEAYADVVTYPVAKALRKALSAGGLRQYAALVAAETSVESCEGDAVRRWREFLHALESHLGRPVNHEQAERGLFQRLERLRALRASVQHADLDPVIVDFLAARLPSAEDDPVWYWRVPVAWAILDTVCSILQGTESVQENAACVDAFQLLPSIRSAFSDLGYDWQAAELGAQLVRLLLAFRPLLQSEQPSGGMTKVADLFDDEGARQFLQVNRHDDVLWFNKEQFEALVYWLLFVFIAQDGVEEPTTRSEAAPSSASKRVRRAQALEHLAAKAQYRVETFLELIGGEEESGKTTEEPA